MKQLKDYTLGEAHDICDGRRGVCKDGNDVCVFKPENDVCRMMYLPKSFELEEQKYFTEDQLAVMREFHKSGFRFIARSEGSSPYFYADTPKKINSYWASAGGRLQGVPKEFFQQIKWEDDEPVYIAGYINVEDAQ